MLLNKSLAIKEESCAPGFNMSKECARVLACSNATRKHKLALIAKSKMSRAFKNLNMNSLPVFYRYQKKVWMMNGSLFIEWFENGLVCCAFCKKIHQRKTIYHFGHYSA